MTGRTPYTFRDFWYEGGGGTYAALCRRFVIASILYYHHDVSPVPDSQYDNWALTLSLKYQETPDWFRERVSLADLRAGTAYALEPTPEEAAICADFVSGRRAVEDYF